MNRLWVAVVVVVGSVGIMVASASAGGGLPPQPQLERKPGLKYERPVPKVSLQVTPAASAPVGQAVTMKVTMANPPLLLQGTNVVYQFQWREHGHGPNSSGDSGYHPATTWTFTPSRGPDLYALRVNWAVADSSGNVRPAGGSSDWYQLQVCAAGQSSC